MPKPSQRTRSKKRIHKVLPSGKRRTHYERESTASPYCVHCGQPLAGIPHVSTSETRKLNRSKRRIWRLYGGKLCPNCLKNALKHAARIS